MVTVKICGLTRRVDAEAAVAAGADYLGFVFFQASRRCRPPTVTHWKPSRVSVRSLRRVWPLFSVGKKTPR